MCCSGDWINLVAVCQIAKDLRIAERCHLFKEVAIHQEFGFRKEEDRRQVDSSMQQGWKKFQASNVSVALGESVVRTSKLLY